MPRGWFLLILAVCLLSGCSAKPVSFVTSSPVPSREQGECVILLHGLGRTYLSMNSMQSALTAAGYYTVNVDYPATEESIEAIAASFVPPAVHQCRQSGGSRIHFVSHSLGGIVVRQALAGGKPAELGRVVMLSPPSQGSVLVDIMQDWPLFIWLNGEAGQQLSTAENSLPNRLGAVNYPVGVITGDRHAFFDAWLAALIPGKDDGKVSVKNAALEGMADFLVVDKSHPFIMNSDRVQAETVYFLKHGHFCHRPSGICKVRGADWFSGKGAGQCCGRIPVSCPDGILNSLGQELHGRGKVGE
jgi:hypothetical protein